MFRIDSDGNVANEFSAGNPSTGQPGTRISAEWLTAMQEEIANFIESMGITLVKATNTQLTSAVMALLARVSTWTARQTFTGGATVVDPPVNGTDPASKNYIDARFVVAARFAESGAKSSQTASAITLANATHSGTGNYVVSVPGMTVAGIAVASPADPDISPIVITSPGTGIVSVIIRNLSDAPLDSTFSLVVFKL